MSEQPFGHCLRVWRHTRHWSQEELAGRAEVSARHVSFLETGKAMPSREMVLRLSRHLDVPLRERNRLLTAAGFAPTYRESSLNDSALAHVREGLTFLIEQHEPWPAIVLDRSWDIRLANSAAMKLVQCIAPRALERPPLNVVRLLFDPALGGRAAIANPREVMAPMLCRLRDEADQLGASPGQRAFYEEMRSLAPENLPEGDTHHPLLALHLLVGNRELRLYTAITTLGTPTDVTLQELRIETYFPADAQSADALRTLASEGCS